MPTKKSFQSPSITSSSSSDPQRVHQGKKKQLTPILRRNTTPMVDNISRRPEIVPGKSSSEGSLSNNNITGGVGETDEDPIMGKLSRIKRTAKVKIKSNRTHHHQQLQDPQRRVGFHPLVSVRVFVSSRESQEYRRAFMEAWRRMRFISRLETLQRPSPHQPITPQGPSSPEEHDPDAEDPLTEPMPIIRRQVSPVDIRNSKAQPAGKALGSAGESQGQVQSTVSVGRQEISNPSLEDNGSPRLQTQQPPSPPHSVVFGTREPQKSPFDELWTPSTEDMSGSQEIMPKRRPKMIRRPTTFDTTQRIAFDGGSRQARASFRILRPSVQGPQQQPTPTVTGSSRGKGKKKFMGFFYSTPGKHS